jgi:hypothetical protein
MIVKNRGDLISSVVVLAGVGILFHQSTLIEVTTEHAGGPNFFPRILMGILSVLALILALRSVSPAEGPAAAATPSDKKSVFKLTTFKLQLSLICFLFLYLAAMPFIGYAPGTALFLTSSMYLLGDRSLKNLVAYAVLAVVVTGLLNYIFGHLLHLFLP